RARRDWRPRDERRGQRQGDHERSLSHPQQRLRPKEQPPERRRRSSLDRLARPGPLRRREASSRRRHQATQVLEEPVGVHEDGEVAGALDGHERLARRVSAVLCNMDTHASMRTLAIPVWPAEPVCAILSRVRWTLVLALCLAAVPAGARDFWRRTGRGELTRQRAALVAEGDRYMLQAQSAMANAGEGPTPAMVQAAARNAIAAYERALALSEDADVHYRAFFAANFIDD